MSYGIEPKYPEIRVKLVGENGNAFSVLGRVRSAFKKAGHADECIEFTKQATSGNYDHLLRTCMKWVTVY